MHFRFFFFALPFFDYLITEMTALYINVLMIKNLDHLFVLVFLCCRRQDLIYGSFYQWE